MTRSVVLLIILLSGCAAKADPPPLTGAPAIHCVPDGSGGITCTNI